MQKNFQEQMADLQKAVNHEQQKKGSRISGYIATILVNILLFYIFNNLLRWHVSYITPDFALVLPVLNLSIGLTIIFNALYIAFDPYWLQAIGRLVTGGIGVYVSYLLYKIFPFNFSPTFNPIFKILLLIGVIFGAIGTIFEFVNLIRKKD